MNRNFLKAIGLVLLLILPGSYVSSQQSDNSAASIQKVPLGDPFILAYGGKYYAYGTHAGNGIEVYVSDDLKSWTGPAGVNKGLALIADDVWGDKQFWAPEIYFVKGKFYMYYSAEEHVNVAVSDSPLGPFKQEVQKPIIENEKCIDNSLFIDDNGKAYMLFDRFNDGLNIWIAELESNLIDIKAATMKKCINVSQKWETVWPRVNEGSFVTKHNGVYYMTYSANSYESPFYGVGVATATNIMGPWTKYENNPVLQKPGDLVGVGHSAMFTDNDGNLRIVFHAHNSQTAIHPRNMYIATVKFVTTKGKTVMEISKDYITCTLTPPPPPAKLVVPVVVNGEVQKIPALEKTEDWIKEDLWVETEFDTDGDGKKDRMHVDVTRPKQTETEGLKLPVIYESSPYFAGTASMDKKYNWVVKQELNTDPPLREKAPAIVRTGKRPVISNSQVRAWLPYGFIVIHSSAPGTGLSQGCPTVGTRIEALAPKAVVDWLNGRAKGFTTPYGNDEVKAYWTTGKVGMIGTSYNGTIPMAAATTGVDGLEVVVPVSPNNSYYAYYRANGLVRSPGGYLGEDVDVLYDFIHSNPDNCAYCDSVYRNKTIVANIDRKTGDYSDFWAQRDLLNYMKDYRAATLMAHGFNDWNVMISHSIRFMKAIKDKGVPLQVYFHQGGHGGEPPFDMLNRWFTRYLFGVQNDVEKDPRAYIVRESDDRLKPTPYADYPNPDAKPVKLYLTKGAPKAGSLVLSKVEKQGKETLVDNYSYTGSMLAQTEWTDNRLIYLTPKLTAPLHISGIPTITVKASSSKPAVNLTVWLVTLPWNQSPTAKIFDNIVDRGWADLQNYKSLTHGEPLKSGKFYEMTFDLEPDDQIIPAGKQLALLIFSTDREFTLWPDPGTKLTLDLDGTSITIPVVGGVIK